MNVTVGMCTLAHKMGKSPVTGYHLESELGPLRMHPTRAMELSFLLRERHFASGVGAYALRLPRDPDDMLRLVGMLIEASHGPMCAEVVKALIREKEVSTENVNHDS